MIHKYIYERFGCPMLFGKNTTTGVEDVVIGGWSSDEVDIRCITQQDAVKCKDKLSELVDFIACMAIEFDKAAPEEFEKFYYITSRETMRDAEAVSATNVPEVE